MACLDEASSIALLILNKLFLLERIWIELLSEVPVRVFAVLIFVLVFFILVPIFVVVIRVPFLLVRLTASSVLDVR